MDDAFDWSERMKAMRRDFRDLQEEVEEIRKKKANGGDVEQIAKKVSDMESEMRAKLSTLSAENHEIREGVRKLLEGFTDLKTELSNQRREVNTLQDNSKTSVWQRIPFWAWMLMAVGGFAVLQLGLERWAEFKGQIP